MTKAVMKIGRLKEPGLSAAEMPSSLNTPIVNMTITALVGITSIRLTL